MDSLTSRPAFFPMMPADIDEVLSIETHVSAFPWARGHFMDSILGGHSTKICRIGGKLAGYLVVMMAVDEAHLLNIGVDEKFHGQGIGASLLRHAMDIGLNDGMKRLLLEVRPSNAQALALYRHYGFRQIGVRRGYYPASGGQREDALVLTRALEDIFA
ncbi:MAG: ribosomal protein S18-alanine N-acetyltransferase [Candidatus Accumulibacter sp.]|jgi:ribosomal-protein-alanine N-acetyltransferase|nr:ribosomal protein S18-alanine N-acetyltransferase [Accumulibacter sp.]